MAIGVPYLVGSTSGKTSVSGATVTLAGAVPVGDTVIVIMAHDGFATGGQTATDAKGNTYTGAGGVINSASEPNMRALLAPVSTALAVSDTVSVVFPGATAAHVVMVYGVAGINAYDLSAVSTQAGSTSATVTLASPTTQADELLLAFCADIGPSSFTFTAGSGYTLLNKVGTTGGTNTSNYTIQTEYQIVAVTGTYSAAMTVGTTSNKRIQLSAFKGGSYATPGGMTATVATGSADSPAAAFNTKVNLSPPVAIGSGAALPATMTGKANVTATVGQATGTSPPATFNTKAVMAGTLAAGSGAAVAPTLTGKGTMTGTLAAGTADSPPGAMLAGGNAIMAGAVATGSGVALPATFNTKAVMAGAIAVGSGAGVAATLGGKGQISGALATGSGAALPATMQGAAILAGALAPGSADAIPATFVLTGGFLAVAAEGTADAIPAFLGAVAILGGVAAAGSAGAFPANMVVVQPLAVGGASRFDASGPSASRRLAPDPTAGREMAWPSIVATRSSGGPSASRQGD